VCWGVLGSVLNSLGKELSQEEVENMISEVDADGNGSFISFYLILEESDKLVTLFLIGFW